MFTLSLLEDGLGKVPMKMDGVICVTWIKLIDGRNIGLCDFAIFK